MGQDGRKDGRKDGRDEVESWKEVKKRSKRMRLPEVALTVHDKGGGDRIANVESNTPPIIPHNSPSHPYVTTLGQPNNLQNSAFPANSSNPSHHSSQPEEQLPKKKRGKTRMKSLALTLNERGEVEFNDIGQPVGKISEKLSSYAGALVREMVPYTISSWKKVGDSLKDDLWTCIQTRFKLDALDKSLVLKMISARWKESKLRVVSAIRAASFGPNCATMFAMLRPDNIKSDQEWSDFIKEKLSTEFELKSKKFKAIRAKNKIPHTMSRKGFARLAHDMKKDGRTDITRDELWCKGHTKKNGEPPNSYVAECITKIKEHSSTQSSKETAGLSEDGVAKTFGPERNGRVRALGFGVTPSQLGVRMCNSRKVHALENQVTGLTTKLQELSDLFMTTIAGRQNVGGEPLTPRANTPQSQHGSNFANSGNVPTQMPTQKMQVTKLGK